MFQPLLEAGLRGTMKHFVKPVLSETFPLAVQRRYTREAYRTSYPPRNVAFRRDDLGGVPVLRVSPSTPAKGTVIYFHGGGYVMGSPDTHRGLAGYLASLSGCEIVLPDYRLAPEHPYPAATDDAEAVYLTLLNQGLKPNTIALAGDSAGGGLSVALAMRLRDHGHPLPSSITCFSPWTDLTEQALYSPDCEPVLHAAWTCKAASMYAADTPLTHPLISPVYGDLSDLPPLLIQVGSQEILLNDARRLADAAKRDHVKTTLEIYNNLWHVFQIHAPQLDRAREALAFAGEHINQHLEG
ncbi:alpha/beta hydrolase [Marinobacter daepoensis]|uniref:Alpha/beta hydrolase n=1 Tax=Marinobacter daepoensis TaxID=262077 RepID=A0ABS3BGX9_9GAMM|nr:alpha/beta hydrolase [Marinobacter daepoensis]MBN7771093.1 alpha/beta hydrolase [Marinobacter daepoensis]MBY6033434.1 alpha/beta hydrolase [Marinobacter daepoensis]MBY6078955.1 alpha/beta hydrolase [Marinobacter daepoensis]